MIIASAICGVIATLIFTTGKSPASLPWGLAFFIATGILLVVGLLAH